MINLSIIVPVFNFENQIEKNLSILIKTIEKFENQYEVILVDDGSVDNTCARITNFIKYKKNIKLLTNRENQGKGFSVRQGFLKSIGKIKLFIDCDIPYLERIQEMYFEVLKNDYDLCIIQRSSQINDYDNLNYIFRRLISHSFNLFIKIFFVNNINDTQSGLKVFKGDIEILDKFILNKFLFDIEILMHCKKKQLKISKLKEYSVKTKIKYNSSFIFDYKIYLDVIRELLQLLKIKKSLNE
jgi:glycosyltransferase involved in cell wall biosynthesis